MARDTAFRIVIVIVIVIMMMLTPIVFAARGVAQGNGGVFSRADVGRIIDGRDPLKGHGGKDMPLWGDAFANSADGPDAVKQKIETLVSFIESLQQKP